MILTDLLNPLAIVIEYLIAIGGLYVGAVLKKPAGYCFAVTFLIFGLYDFFVLFGVNQDILALLNIIAVIAGLYGIVLLAKKS
jgi:hypothetical protein